MNYAGKSIQDPAMLIGLAGLYLYSLFAVLGGAGAEIGSAMMLLASLAQIRQFWLLQRREPLFWLVVASAGYVLISAVLASKAFPDWADDQWDQASNWLRLALVPIVAWWLKGDPRRSLIALGLFAAGAVLRMLRYAPWDQLSGFLRLELSPHRGGFGLYYISFSSYLVVISIGLLVLFPPLAKRLPQGWPRLLAWGIALVLLVVCLFGILAGKSRGTWLAFALTMPWLAVYYAVLLWREHSVRELRILVMVSIGVLGLVAVMAGALGSKVLERLTVESQAYGPLLEGDLNEVPNTSFGSRIWYYRLAIEKIAERPLFGWGVGSARPILWERFHRDEGARHFHNIVLGMLVRFGIVGFSLAVAVIAVIYWRFRRAFLRKEIPVPWYVFFLSVAVFCLIWGQSDIRITEWDYRDFFILFSAIVMASVYPWADNRYYRELRRYF